MLALIRTAMARQLIKKEHQGVQKVRVLLQKMVSSVEQDRNNWASIDDRMVEKEARTLMRMLQ